MNYRRRPAWRTQWVAITVTVFVFVLYLIKLPQIASTPEGQLAAAFLAGILLVVFLAILYRHYSWSFTVTHDSIEARHGVIARNIKSIRVKDLRNVNLRQSVFQRILGVGDLEFSTAGGAGIEVTFHGVARPMELKRQIQGLQDLRPA